MKLRVVAAAVLVSVVIIGLFGCNRAAVVEVSGVWAVEPLRGDLLQALRRERPFVRLRTAVGDASDGATVSQDDETIAAQPPAVVMVPGGRSEGVPFAWNAALSDEVMSELAAAYGDAPVVVASRGVWPSEAERRDGSTIPFVDLVVLRFDRGSDGGTEQAEEIASALPGEGEATVVVLAGDRTNSLLEILSPMRENVNIVVEAPLPATAQRMRAAGVKIDGAVVWDPALGRVSEGEYQVPRRFIRY